MTSVRLGAALILASLLAGCGPSPLIKERAAKDDAILECLRAAGFRRSDVPPDFFPDRKSSGEGPMFMPYWFLQAPDAPEGWITVFYARGGDDPANAAAVAAALNKGWPGLAQRGARAVGSRTYAWTQETPYVNPALDRCLLMP